LESFTFEKILHVVVQQSTVKKCINSLKKLNIICTNIFIILIINKY